ncbi:MAG: beta-phosphoglucomutase [Anaerolineae bacterium]|nr:beta-phosphoglucomutase [Anaerolineae bacterium]
MPALEAFVFDLDGVITDTAEYHYRAWKRLADEEGIPFTREDNEALRGVSRRQSLLLLLKGRVLPEDQMEVWMTRKNGYYRSYLTEVTPNDLLPGVGAFLRDAKQRGIKLGLASASKNARDVIERLGIADLMDAIGDGYSVSNPKPAPDLFVWVAGRLGVYPSRTVVFEDAEAGVEAALAGGMYAVGLGPVNRVGKAHLVLPGLNGAKVSDVLMALVPAG